MSSFDYETKRQKAIDTELGCKFVRTDPNKEAFHIFRTLNEQKTKKYLINKISTR